MELTQLDYYAALEVPPTASAAQIAQAYQFALDSYGTDSLAAYGVLSDTEREEISAFLHEAFATLSDPERRRNYNLKLAHAGTYPAEQLQAWMASEPSVEPPASPEAVSDERAALPANAGSATPRQPAVAPPPVPSSEPLPGRPSPEPPAAHQVQVTPPPARPNTVPVADQAAFPLHESPPVAPAPSAVIETPAEIPAPPPQELVIPALDGRPIGGPELREIREARGLRLEDVSNQTKISLSNLRFLEEANYRFLPAPVYVRGFLRTYAKMLRIDAEKVLQDYMAGYEAGRQA